MTTSLAKYTRSDLNDPPRRLGKGAAIRGWYPVPGVFYAGWDYDLSQITRDGKVSPVPKPPDGFIERGIPSPDGKRMAWIDHDLNLSVNAGNDSRMTLVGKGLVMDVFWLP